MTTPTRDTRGAGTLWAAVATGFAASLCCVGPLILVAAGVGGAWMADLTALDPIRPWLTGVTLLLAALAHVRYRRHCAACPRDKAGAVWLWLGTTLVVAALLAPYALPILLVPSLPHTP